VAARTRRPTLSCLTNGLGAVHEGAPLIRRYVRPAAAEDRTDGSIRPALSAAGLYVALGQNPTQRLERDYLGDSGRINTQSLACPVGELTRCREPPIDDLHHRSYGPPVIGLVARPQMYQ
jgi:hypothetical protein